jgi:hypothetical protein
MIQFQKKRKKKKKKGKRKHTQQKGATELHRLYSTNIYESYLTKSAKNWRLKVKEKKRKKEERRKEQKRKAASNFNEYLLFSSTKGKTADFCFVADHDS